MGMEVGVVCELVARGGKEGGGHKTSIDTERRQKGRIASVSVCFFFVQSPCNNVQQTAAAMRPRFCRLALRFRLERTCLRTDDDPLFSF